MNKNNINVSLEEAREIIINSIVPLGSEEVTIFDASGRVLYEDIISDINNPPLDNSAMDGYAIISEDSHGALKENPKIINVIGEVKAGEPRPDIKITRGNAFRIMTGAPVPEGADSIVQFEDTEENNNRVKIFRKMEKYENYRFAGESIKKGDIVLTRGDRLTSADLGLLASLNYNRIIVYKRPTVAIISTGDEIIDINEEIKPGKIRNSNSYTLYSEVKKYGAVPYYLGITKDTIENTLEKLNKGLNYDIVISTGGVSMGKYDFVKKSFADLNIEILFEKVKVKPGRPIVFGIKNEKLVFGLPGNPVSTLTSFIQFVRPAILKLMGAKKLHKPVVNATLEENIKKKPGRVNLIRGYFTIKNNEFFVSPAGSQDSATLRSMSIANCLMIIPENTTKINAGEKVAIQLINHDEN